MGSNSSIAQTVGTGTTVPVKTFLDGDADHQQIVREARATAVTTNTWTVSTTASTDQIPADVNRVSLTIVSNASSRVYLRFDSTAPTSSSYHWYLEPGERLAVSPEDVQLPVSMLGAAAGGTVLSRLGTCS